MENDALEAALTKFETTGDYSDLAELGFGVEYLEYLREQERQQNDRENAFAMFEATGDTKYLTDIGADVGYILEMRDNEERERLLSQAYAAAEVGDLSKLSALGIDTSYAQNMQNKNLYSGTGGSSGTVSGYTDSEESVLATKLMLGAHYWEPAVWDYCRNTYGLDPIDVYYSSRTFDENGNTTEVTFYDVLKDVLDDVGESQRIISPDEWAKGTDQLRNNTLKQWGASSYDDYLHKIADKYLQKG